ncbi:GAD-like domain-containing protein [Streptococcus ruminantium]|uniref:GAD-like domain-containing protein n=1 Tax=Streptococcus ruminantium TaxID=1917441 RepID=UPI0012DD00FB|nr:GAD-like domain-containing protein [Streptococcus ruminantium]BDD38987.1 hypothetical protein GUT183_12250 [Streptococcus ruminantium]
MNQFIKLADMPIEIIEKYRDVLLQMIINFWEAYGISTALNGYLKSINLDNFAPFVRETFVLGKGVIPIFVTAFGDVITLVSHNGEYKMFYIVKYKGWIWTGYARS